MRYLWLSINLSLLVCGSLSGAVLLENRFQSDRELADWTVPKAASVSVRDGALEINCPERTRTTFVTQQLSATELAGRIIRLSGEFSGTDIRCGDKPYFGGKVMFELHYGEQPVYCEVSVPAGTFNWKKFSRTIPLKQDLSAATLVLGLQGASGTLRIRNLRLEILGVPLDWTKAANMALVDEKAGDGKGGWSDQGPQNDGRNFRSGFGRIDFSGIPFLLKSKGNAVLTMRSTEFPAGPQEVKLPAAFITAKNLYLMHTLCWGPRADEVVGNILLTGSNGKTQKIEIRNNRDARDWWQPAACPNAAVILRGTNGKGESVGLYLSKFPVDPELGPVVSVTFRSAGGKPIWIIAGATLSPDEIPLPGNKKLTIQPGKDWLPIRRDSMNCRIPGSALDVSGYLPVEKAGAHGRVIINSSGRFAFEDAPEKPLRFFTAAYGRFPKSHKRLQTMVRELRKNGYNMIRTHFLDSFLMTGAKKDLEFNPELLDAFDYLIFLMKENGIYLNFDAMTSWNGYSPGLTWEIKDKNLKKNAIFFDPAVRENWRRGVEKILCHVNPYTRTRLIDEPMLVMIVGFNEQEFAFRRPFNEELVGPAWREFLRRRYGSIDKLKAAWGKKSAGIRSFNDIPCFKSNDFSDNDVALFLREIESGMMDWYRSELRKMGFRGAVTNYNMERRKHYHVVRSGADVITINTYHAHPSGDIISQASSISSAALVVRDSIAARQAGKPLVITEHNHVFWNRFRYEQGFATGAYAAFQDVDGLTAFATPVSLAKVASLRSFNLCSDPIAVASEFLTFFAYVRGDVSPVRTGVRVPVDVEEVYRSAAGRGAIASDRTNLVLLTGFSIECVGRGIPVVPLRPGELRIPAGNSAQVITSTAGFSSSVDQQSDGTAMVRLLKEKGILPAANRSNGNTLFESSTGELLMDTRNRFLSVNTARLQGICALAGTTARLDDFEIRSMSVNGNLALVAIDEMKPIRDARRLVLVYATNALNNGMVFVDSEMTHRLKSGGLPTLIQAGKFTVAIRNRHAASLRLYPLDLAGNRLKMLNPVKVEGEYAIFSADTAKDGAALFFELVAEGGK